MQDILIKLQKLVNHYKGYILTKGHNYVLYFEKNASLKGLLKTQIRP